MGRERRRESETERENILDIKTEAELSYMFPRVFNVLSREDRQATKIFIYMIGRASTLKMLLTSVSLRAP